MTPNGRKDAAIANFGPCGVSRRRSSNRATYSQYDLIVQFWEKLSADT